MFWEPDVLNEKIIDFPFSTWLVPPTTDRAFPATSLPEFTPDPELSIAASALEVKPDKLRDPEPWSAAIDVGAVPVVWPLKCQPAIKAAFVPSAPARSKPAPRKAVLKSCFEKVVFIIFSLVLVLAFFFLSPCSLIRHCIFILRCSGYSSACAAGQHRLIRPLAPIEKFHGYTALGLRDINRPA